MSLSLAKFRKNLLLWQAHLYPKPPDSFLALGSLTPSIVLCSYKRISLYIIVSMRYERLAKDFCLKIFTQHSTNMAIRVDKIPKVIVEWLMLVIRD